MSALEEVAALRDNRILDMAEVARQCHDAERKKLADLRAKVEGLGLCVEPDDGEPACFCNDVALHAASVTLDKVLALIEEAERG